MTTAEEVYRAYLDRHEWVSGGSLPAQWSKAAFCFLDGAPEETTILRVDLASGEVAPLVDVAAVRTALTAATGQEPPHWGLPFDAFTLTEDERVAFTYRGISWTFSPASGALEHATLTDPPRTWKRSTYITDLQNVPEHRSPDGEWLTGIVDHNIVVRSTRDGTQRQLTDDGTTECFWDMESLRSGFMPGNAHTLPTLVGVSPWSPDSVTLLAHRRDVSGVYRSPRIRWSTPFEQVDFSLLQKAGTTLDRIHPVFVDVRSGRRTPVALTEIENRYIQWLGWHPAGLEALLIIYTRNFKRVEIVAASRESGGVRTLMSETATTCVKNYEALHLGEHGFCLLPEGSGFLWLSTRDGWNHLYHYDMEGHLVRQLTRGAWPVYSIEHVDADGFVYFCAACDSTRPYDVHVCRTPLKGGPITQLTQEKGLHAPAFAPDGLAFLDLHSSVDRPLRTDLMRANGSLIRVLSRMDISRLKSLGYIPAEEFTVKAADGLTDLWGVLYKPFDFDPSASYPVVEYIYGAPNITAERFFAVHRKRYANMPWALAQRGYIVVCLDARGTPGRSKSFLDFIHGNWTAGVADHAAAIQQLCERNGWMDANRVGITGHSWGGYFATSALIQYPQTYHAAVSYEGAYDPWDGITYEIFLDLPQNNRALYDQANLTQQAARIRGPYMMIAGTSYCPTTSGAMRMTRALIEAGIEHECVVVPDAGHHFKGAEEDYLLLKLTRWLDRHIKQRTPTTPTRFGGRDNR